MYKSGQGMTSRIGVLVLIVAFGAYAGYSWYAHFHGTESVPVGPIGAAVLVLFFSGLGVFTALKNPRSCDFLIDMDVELRKVMWPDTSPPFDPKAEAWGATYVVIITVFVFAVFIYVVDLGLSALLQEGLFPVLFGTG